MTKLIAAFVAICYLPLCAYAFQNEPTGFRGIEWLTPLEKVQDQLSEVERGKNGLNVFYLRKGDKMAIGEAELARLTYVFYKGRFHQVMIRTAQGVRNKMAIREAVASQFGSGDQPNRYIERWFWRGPQTFMFLDCARTDYCSLSIMSTEGFEEAKRDSKTAAEGAKKDF